MASAPVNEEKLHETALALMSQLNGLCVAIGIQHGVRLGLFEARSDGGPATSAERADRTELNERWVREWLYQQASGGVVEHENAERFSLTPESALLLADESTPTTMLPLFATLQTLIDGFDHLPEAMRTGIGQPYDGHGEEGAATIERSTAPMIPINKNAARQSHKAGKVTIIKGVTAVPILPLKECSV